LKYSIIKPIHKKERMKILQTTDWSHCWPHFPQVF
jgi:hypothetical protein